jgi:hypothetical protein
VAGGRKEAHGRLVSPSIRALLGRQSRWHTGEWARLSATFDEAHAGTWCHWLSPLVRNSNRQWKWFVLYMNHSVQIITYGIYKTNSEVAVAKTMSVVVYANTNLYRMKVLTTELTIKNHFQNNRLFNSSLTTTDYFWTWYGISIKTIAVHILPPSQNNNRFRYPRNNLTKYI